MRHNLVVTYDLFKGGTLLTGFGGQDYARMEAAIKPLGRAVKVNFSVWMISSDLDADSALNKLRNAGDPNDKIVVFDATANVVAWTTGNFTAAENAQIRAIWSGTSMAGKGLAEFMFAPPTNNLVGLLGLGSR